MFLIRKLHKWFGLVLGLQFLLWTVSGAVMALLDHDKVAGEGALRPPAHVALPARPLSLAQVAEAVGSPVLKLQLKPLADRYVYEAVTPAGVRLLDAADGQPVSLDATTAREFAVARYSGQAPVASVQRIERATLETRAVKLPVWRVAFSDKAHTTLLVSAETGEVLGVKNDTWRLWDVAWMFHIMDYADRQSFNHPLIVTVATGAAWLALSGLILLFRSFRRSDVAWILDPIETAAARRKRR